MTQHEMLAILDLAEEAHAKPPPIGHGGPLTMYCLRTVLHDNAETLGYQPGMLWNQFERGFGIMLRKGWVEFCDEECGGSHFTLTDAGEAQLREWNEQGCEAHTRMAGRPIVNRAGCAAPKIMEQDYSFGDSGTH